MTNENNQTLVLVTGGSGFVAVHCIHQLLQSGYKVRTTLRSLKRDAEVRAMLKKGGVEAGDNLSSTQADLLDDKGWPEAVAGCTYVLHVASPFPALAPKDEDELIKPALEGTLRVLKASRDAGVKRVVLTSSFAAIGHGVKPPGVPFDDSDWTDPNGDISAYVKSKTLAERAAWDFIHREGGALELSVVNPVGIFGPAWGTDLSTSVQIILRLLNGSVPGLPKVYFGAVDVRDVASLHLLAMTNPAAKGERFLAVAGDFHNFQEIAALLKSNLGPAASKVPTLRLPTWLLRVGAIFNQTAKQALPELGKVKNATSQKAIKLLGWSPRSREEAIIASAKSLIELGLVKR